MSAAVVWRRPESAPIDESVIVATDTGAVREAIFMDDHWVEPQECLRLKSRVVAWTPMPDPPEAGEIEA